MHNGQNNSEPDFKKNYNNMHVLIMPASGMAGSLGANWLRNNRRKEFAKFENHVELVRYQLSQYSLDPYVSYGSQNHVENDVVFSACGVGPNTLNAEAIFDALDVGLSASKVVTVLVTSHFVPNVREILTTFLSTHPSAVGKILIYNLSINELVN